MIQVFVDGSAFGDKASGYHAGCGWSVVNDGKEVDFGFCHLYNANASEAEYHGIIQGIHAARNLRYHAFEVRSDAQTVIGHLNGRLQTGVALEVLKRKVLQAAGICRVSFVYAERGETRRAHNLAVVGAQSLTDSGDRLLTPGESEHCIRLLHRLCDLDRTLKVAAVHRVRAGRQEDIIVVREVLDQYREQVNELLDVICEEIDAKTAQPKETLIRRLLAQWAM